jgi:hypothetical protein
VVAGLLATHADVWGQQSNRRPEPQPVPSIAGPLLKTYGVADTEFMFGAYVTKFRTPTATYADYQSCDSVWSFLHRLGCSVLYVTAGRDGEGFNFPGVFANTAVSGDRVMLVDYADSNGPFGRDIELYPWDSAETILRL